MNWNRHHWFTSVFPAVSISLLGDELCCNIIQSAAAAAGFSRIFILFACWKHMDDLYFIYTE